MQVASHWRCVTSGNAHSRCERCKLTRDPRASDMGSQLSHKTPHELFASFAGSNVAKLAPQCFQTLLLVFFLDTCRCHKRLTTNYRLFPPYVNQFPLTHTGNISVENMTGMLPQILNDLIVTCCQTCASHGESFVDFMYNGTNGEAKQESERNMKLLIEDRNDLR